MELLDTKLKNQVLASMMRIIDEDRKIILAANQKDLDAFDRDDRALYDRLVLDDQKIEGMIQALDQVKGQEDPVGLVKEERKIENGLRILNKTAPFGTIMIIYESRPDVTIEAAVLAFKANNRILLKGGKEALHSNLALVDCWHKALAENNLDKDWIQFLQMNRQETQDFLRKPDQQLDLIVPRGGERLIQFVKEHATCAVLVSGRGNNFAYLAQDADPEKSIRVLLNAKTHKISACNALDKILIHKEHPHLPALVAKLQSELQAAGVEIWADESSKKLLTEAKLVEDQAIWYEEFLALKAVIALVDEDAEAIHKINRYSGGHSATILTEDGQLAQKFMEQVDGAAVYHNASTRFTDGGAMGVGAELAISTDKLHHRGPLGLKQLVTNKYYVYGDGQVRV
ncbi:glutamate-5-semialdehyde dehydrogenase [Croceimicrobium sp.]|uniref:glutamate-5-semialdehyde dehydrogenase n=1 Tax=Croceimicrobium sp. TaxID=2828340 RepID=UPI003BAA39C9